MGASHSSSNNNSNSSSSKSSAKQQQKTKTTTSSSSKNATKYPIVGSNDIMKRKQHGTSNCTMKETNFGNSCPSRLEGHVRLRQRRDSTRSIYIISSIVMAVLAKAEGFTSSSPYHSHATNIRTKSSLHLAETDVYPSTEQASLLAAPFPPPTVVTEEDKKNDNEKDVEIRLQPAFFQQQLSAEKKKGNDRCWNEHSRRDELVENYNPSDAETNQSDYRTKAHEEDPLDCSTKGAERADRLGKVSKADTLLSTRSIRSSCESSRESIMTTSVVARRAGSATKDRGSGRSMARLVDAVRNGASTPSSCVSKDNTSLMQKNLNDTITSLTKEMVSTDPHGDVLCSGRTSRALIESTVQDLWIGGRNSMGLFGESLHRPKVIQRPKPGTVLLKATTMLSMFVANTATDAVDVRVATPEDDLAIANLRLSVFSDFTQHSRKIFCDRSCHLLSARRQRGAICVVATKPKRLPGDEDIIVGTAEISYHEFSGTRLGQARPDGSILYVTEVAVNSRHRRKGVAKSMMEAVEKVAMIRNVETIYLHVDITNIGALRLYKMAGFQKLSRNNPVFKEFTTKLNLHDGATKGRKHFLMSKDIRNTTWLESIEGKYDIPSQKGVMGIERYE